MNDERDIIQDYLDYSKPVPKIASGGYVTPRFYQGLLPIYPVGNDPMTQLTAKAIREMQERLAEVYSIERKKDDRTWES